MKKGGVLSVYQDSPTGPRGPGVRHHERCYHRHPDRATAPEPRCSLPRSSARELNAFWPRPSRPRSPTGSSTTATVWMSRATAGRPQWLPARADHPHGHRRRRGQAAAGPRPPARGPAGEVQFGDPAAVPAQDQERRGVDPLAVPQGRQHRRLQRSPDGPARPRRQGAVGHHGHPAEGRLGAGVQGLEPAVAGGQALRLRLGRWRATSTSAWRMAGSASWC